MNFAAVRESSSCTGFQTFGNSPDSEYVFEKVSQGLAQLKNSNLFGAGIDAAFQELDGLEDRCALEGWDGYEAAPIEQETFRLAKRFLDAIPLGIAAPSVGAEPDGQIAFEWYQSPRRILSVSISPKGDLHYAALLGYRESYGTEHFFGEVPLDILRLIRRVNVE